MPNPLTDKLDMGDQGVKIGLHCAQCGEKVFPNQPHTCSQKAAQQEKETKDEN